jgi:transposase-like protein
MDNFSVFKGENEIEFYARFSTKDSCLAYLSHYKWENGFKCSSCGCTEEYFCNQAYHKRCKKCLHLESATSGTLFHNIKFGIVKAFIMIFKMSATTKSISAEQLSKTVGVNRKTGLLFQHKIRLAMASSEEHPLTGDVEVDEAFIGGAEDSEHRGRGAETKSLIAVAVEKSGLHGIKRVYAVKIDNASSDELKKMFEKHISPIANVLTDKWSGYLPIKKTYRIEQEKSSPKENFKTMHRCIQQIKSWIRGIHHSVDSRFLQAYLDEFCYRINRSSSKDSIFDNLLKRVTNHKICDRNMLINKYC